MPWYKLKVSHGPGHQSRGLPGEFGDDAYLFYYDELPKNALREEFDYLTRELDYPIGTMELVDRLPSEEIEWKIIKYLDKIEGAKKAIAELEEMRQGKSCWCSYSRRWLILSYWNIKNCPYEEKKRNGCGGCTYYEDKNITEYFKKAIRRKKEE